MTDHSPTRESRGYVTREHQKAEEGGCGGGSEPDNCPSVRVQPPLGDIRTEDICGAIGPMRDGTILRCTRTEDDHRRRHRNCRVVPEVKWTYGWTLETDEDGLLVGSYRPHGGQLPGPRPTGARQTVASQDAARIDSGQAYEEALERLEQLRDATPEHEAPSDGPGGHESPARPSRPHPEAKLCPAVDELEERDCRAWWIAAHEGEGEDVVHACDEPLDHDEQIPRGREGHRHQCPCGRRRRAEPHGQLEATARPEAELEIFADDAG